jgi:3',5'-nucleoside bisphosphate phosphatase
MKRRVLSLSMAVVVSAIILDAQNDTRTPLPVPDIAGYHTLKGDFHLHTVFSDGRVWPTVHVREAWRDGLDVIALTEHAEYHPNQDDVRVDNGRSLQVAKAVADQLGILLVPGVEITKPDPLTAPATLPKGAQHFNALFVTDANALNTPDLMESLRRARMQGAFVFWDHPRFRVARAEWFPPIARAFGAGLFQGMELVNGPDFYEEAYPWIAERRLTVLANSDAHDPIPPRATGFRRAITLLFVKTRDLAGVREALESRRTAAWLSDDVWGAEELVRGIWDGAITSMHELPRTPGWAPTLHLVNRSAIAMTLHVVEAPPWVHVGDGVVPAEGELAVPVGIDRDAPETSSPISITIEVRNLHIGPGQSLRVPVSFSVVQ